MASFDDGLDAPVAIDLRLPIGKGLGIRGVWVGLWLPKTPSAAEFQGVEPDQETAMAWNNPRLSESARHLARVRYRCSDSHYDRQAMIGLRPNPQGARPLTPFSWDPRVCDPWRVRAEPATSPRANRKCHDETRWYRWLHAPAINFQQPAGTFHRGVFFLIRRVSGKGRALPG